MTMEVCDRGWNLDLNCWTHFGCGMTSSMVYVSPANREIDAPVAVYTRLPDVLRLIVLLGVQRRGVGG